MARDHILMFTLSVIVAVNIIAIILLNNHLADQTQAAPASPAGIAGTAEGEGLLPQQGGMPGSGQPQQNGQQPGLPSGSSTGREQRAVIRTQPKVRTLILEDKERCPDCYDINQYIAALNDTIYMDIERVPPDKESLFASTAYPALAFNKTLELYPSLIEGWDQAGYTITFHSGEYAGTWYVLPTQNAPYYSTKDARVHGRVTATYLTMSSCSECYDVYIHRTFLNSSRIVPYREVTVDAESAEGRRLIAKYNITAVPTVLLDREAGEYSNLRPGWSIVGSVEPDGTHVFRDLKRLQVVYYDIGRKKLMKP